VSKVPARQTANRIPASRRATLLRIDLDRMQRRGDQKLLRQLLALAVQIHVTVLTPQGAGTQTVRAGEAIWRYEDGRTSSRSARALIA